MNFSNALARFRLIAFIEGCSYLFLLVVAVPVKYLTDTKEAVAIPGMVHGVLFILFGIALINVWYKRKWKFLRALIAFISSLLPFGTFIFDRSLKQEQLQSAN